MVSSNLCYNLPMERIDNEMFMNMTPWEFDQSPNGWRKLSLEHKNLKAAELIKAYIYKNKENILKNEGAENSVSLELMHFHVGQQLAISGTEKYPEAIVFFKMAFYKNEKATSWNAYVSATIGFLENEINIVEDAIRVFDALEGSKSFKNLAIMKNFKKALEQGKENYLEVYSQPRDN